MLIFSAKLNLFGMVFELSLQPFNWKFVYENAPFGHALVLGPLTVIIMDLNKVIELLNDGEENK